MILPGLCPIAFSEQVWNDPFDSSISGWTEYDSGTIATTSWVTGGYARIALSDTGAAGHGLLGNSGPTEGVTDSTFSVLAKIRSDVLPSANPFGPGIMLDASNWFALVAFGTNTLRLQINNAGSPNADLATQTGVPTWATNTWYWFRFERTSGGAFRGKAWADGGAEPGSWSINSTSAESLPSGLNKVGFAARATGTASVAQSVDCDIIYANGTGSTINA